MGGGSEQYPNTRAGIPFVRRVLVVAGANEIIRPHNPDWWNAIIKGEKGTTCYSEVGRWSDDK
eukprot:1889030-Prorocentrum_lima.AAC.1